MKISKQTLIILAVFALIAFIIVFSQKPAIYADKDELAKALPVKICMQDSDCVLTTAGTCGGGCQTAVNQKYKTIWESTPDSEAFQKVCAVAGACVPTSYVAKCMLSECKTGAECIGSNDGLCIAAAK